ncbi:uncharacterized protein IM:7136021 isoform X1 [Latimeria chalumnae]|uniref:uncharacterized protein IM:7136021 isoform X1 n=1 Tax=Latimeria chalumnae TaxID=7897 RepID=UPI0003C15C12|nr:PREDICTED: uncharacterized protein LOC102365394 isoform X1 [Latimeria chalumnae]XP_005992744.1 PREDICTED: uncharacterized protein LOC102365394 isoform X1 [Latimeria chalumnae]XP_005992745.1 PREDICTED: uncharacterized protein LOC102365394 isoform X1 [Latimeria chalumnae]XP_005992747.1 PREDICTED: uncharacterized protein LOC102365394 isoform X1 [Latimeria chalumnae]XP_014341975.1 PREDICTED: uncharacterized protein LOC102365394 isoform X1 [Latimeria chalumnae]XP_014341977.1 PREDICTED: uncharact|eukprot:XP_005992743.1 PREDICTED: uncharacterized protein LOC102365394 isoform X1 [Latimeria chalumnae]
MKFECIWQQLPQEIFTEIFSYLSSDEKANVRATCKYFQKLIDHPTLWKNNTIVLRSISSFNVKFWQMLQKRKICSVIVKRVGMKQWKMLTQSLPDLVAVTVDAEIKEEALQGLKPLVHLQKLHLRNCSRLSDHVIVKDVAHLKNLTNLMLCKISCGHGSGLLGLAQLKNLHTLALHTREGCFPERMLQYVLFQLPGLKELSLKVKKMDKLKLSLCFSLPNIKEHQQTEPLRVSKLHLKRLDLVDSGDTGLSDEALDQLSCIRSLGLWHHKKTLLGTEDILETMLRKLPDLTEIDLAWAASFEPYVKLMPTSIEKLSVIGAKVSNCALSWLANHAGKLKHLNLDHCHGFDRMVLKVFPEKFPSLQTLGLRNAPLTDETLLDLVNLKHLQKLDICNAQYITLGGIQHFQTLTDNRIQLMKEHSLVRTECCCCCF